MNTIDLNDPVTRHMRPDMPLLSAGATVGESLAQLRSEPPGGRIVYFYVVDDGLLRGVVPARSLLLSPSETLIEDVMVRDVHTLSPTSTVLDACEMFSKHRLLAFPIVENGRLRGVVDIDIYAEEAGALEKSHRAEELFQLVGVHLADARPTTTFAAFGSRFPWLLTNIAGGIVAAFLSGMFSADLERTVAIALFIPVVLALSESVSIQSVSLALERLHGRRSTLREIASRLRAEAGTGFLLGAFSAALVTAVAWFWIGSVGVCIALLAGITLGVICAASIGLATPMLLRLARRNPQVAAGPIALAASDLVTLLTYFYLARMLA